MRFQGMLTRRALLDKSHLTLADSHPKIVYHKDGASTHAMRFATEDDDKVENDKQVWIQGAIIGWVGYPISDLRGKMFQAFADQGSRPKIDDALFAEYLKKSIGGRVSCPLDVFAGLTRC